MGDFNIRLDKPDSLSLEFIDLMEVQGFNQLVKNSTHNAGGCLDLIFAPFWFPIDNINVLDTKALADHYPITFDIKLTTTKLPSHFEIKHRNWDKIDSNILKNSIQEVTDKILDHDIINSSNINNSIINFNMKISQELDKQAPVLSKRVKVKKHLVANKEIQDARRVKRRVENMFRKIKSDENKLQLKIARKNLARIVREARAQFFKDKFREVKHDAKKTFKIVNQLLNKNQDKILPSYTNEKSLADKFAVFYRSKIEDIRASLNSTIIEKPTSNIDIALQLNEFTEVTTEDIIEIITHLANKQSITDPIPCKFVKLCKSELAPFFKKLINSSFKFGYFPDYIKTGIITPILKHIRLDRELLNSFRPVCSLTILSKIFEICALKQLTTHLQTNNLYCKYQSAYRKDHSTETALMKVYDDILEYLSPNTYATLVLLDFSAAFDTIDHEILITRLDKIYGIKGRALDWFSSYLNKRNYKVKINNTTSNSTELNYGVPQGSILGPIIFSLYIKPIEKIAHSHNINIHFYADDIQLYFKCDKNTDFAKLDKCLEDIKLWCNKNFLKLNNSKTKIIPLYSKSYKFQKLSELNLMGNNVKVETSVKNLGFIIDQNLSMSKQINHVCAIGYAMLRRLWKISNKIVDRKLKIQLVHATILSRINYCNALYVNLPKKTD